MDIMSMFFYCVTLYLELVREVCYEAVEMLL